MKPNQLQMASEVIACLHVHMYMYTRVLFLAFMHAGAPAERRQALRGEAVRSRPASAVECQLWPSAWSLTWTGLSRLYFR